VIQKTKGGNNKYQFVVISADGGILMRSEWYNSENELDHIVAQMVENIDNNITIERTTNHNGQFQFLLKNNANNLIGFSEPYSSEAGMENGIKNLNKSIYNSK